MQKIGASTNTANPSGEFTEGNPAAGIAATLLKAQWLNAIQRELVRVVEAAGLTLDAADDSQILKAIQTIQERANSWLKLTDKPATVAGFGITDVFTKAETTTAIQQKVAALVDSSPAALDTLRELAAALGNDPNFATTMTNALAAKANKATTLGGYGITDGATRGDINNAVSNLLPKEGGRMTGTIVLNNGSNDSPEIAWQTPDIDIRVDVIGKSLRFFAVSGGETTYPLMMHTNEKLVTMFGNTAWHAGNFNPAECIKKGQTLIPGESIRCTSSAVGPIAGAVGDSAGLEVRGSGSGAAIFSFHRPGIFGVNFGLDTDNQLKVGGWSMGGVAHTIWHSGSFDLAGAVMYFSFNDAPPGFLRANGAAVSRSAYPKLFARIGTTYGAGDGSTTFNLPDLRGEFIRGLDDGRGVDPGRGLGSVQLGAIEAHDHAIYASGNNSSYGGQGTGSGPGNWTMRTASTGTSETRPRNLALLACIKY